MAHMRVRGQQATETVASASASSQPRQPTTTIALSTTFTPPASCTSNRLTIQPPPVYLIWANEPVPFENTTFSDCYPSEFLQSYTSVTSGTLGSSMVPIMSPLVCPQDYCVEFVRGEYMACCPFGYKLTPPEDPVIDSRPAYGGTCYSPFTVGATETVVAYDTDGSTRLQLWAASTSGSNAYAHPIDGFANSIPPVGCNAAISTSIYSKFSPAEIASSLSSTVTLRDTTAAAKNPNKTSSGTISGAAVGGVIGLVVIVASIFFLMRKRRHQQLYSMPGIHQIDGAPRPHAEKDGNMISGEMDSEAPAAELAARLDNYTYIRGPHEMSAGVACEMPAGPELNNIRDRTDLCNQSNSGQ